MRSDVFVNSFKECESCGKKFSIFLYDKQRYVYKVKEKTGKTKYFCSYPCYRKYMTKTKGNEREI